MAFLKAPVHITPVEADLNPRETPWDTLEKKTASCEGSQWRHPEVPTTTHQTKVTGEKSRSKNWNQKLHFKKKKQTNTTTL